MNKISKIALCGALLSSVLFGMGCSKSSSTDNGSVSKTATVKESSKKNDKVYEIKLATTNPSSDITVQLFNKYVKKIYDLTDGHVDIQVYPDGQILVNEEGIEAILGDASVITFNDLSVLGDYVPEFNTICAPYLFSGYEDVEAFNTTEAYEELCDLGDQANIHIITDAFCVGSRSVLAGGVEVYSVDDCKDLNIRVPGVSLFVDSWDAFGANYSATGWSNGVTECETGILNGAEGTSERMVSSGLYQILDNPVYSEIKYMVSSTALEVGYGFWQTLPEEYRDIITEQFIECAKEDNRIIASREAENIQKLKDGGVKVISYDEIDIDSFVKAIEPTNSKLKNFAKYKAAVEEATK